MYPDRTRKGRRNLLLVTFVVVMLYALDQFSGGWLRTPIRSVYSAISQGADTVFYGIFESGYFASKSNLAAENRTLHAQVASLEEQLAAESVAAAENIQLRAFAHLASSTPGITAPIASSFTASPYGTFLIGAGSREGVAQGALVLSPEGFVIGLIRDVQAHKSLVSEIFAAGSSVDVTISGVPVTLSGRGGGNAEGSAPRGSIIATGTPAIAASLRHRPVALVGALEGDASSASISVFARSPVNLLALQYVYVENL